MCLFVVQTTEDTCSTLYNVHTLECPVGGRKSSSPKNNDPLGIIRRSRNKIKSF